MTAPEATPHLTQARQCCADLLTALREARQAGEAEPARLAHLSHAARGIDAMLEAEEVL